MSDTEEVVVSTWVVYDHPTDFPENIVVRRWDIVRGNPEPQPSGADLFSDVKTARDFIKTAGGETWLHRAQLDDPAILEVWV